MLRFSRLLSRVTTTFTYAAGSRSSMTAFPSFPVAIGASVCAAGARLPVARGIRRCRAPPGVLYSGAGSYWDHGSLSRSRSTSELGLAARCARVSRHAARGGSFVRSREEPRLLKVPSGAPAGGLRARSWPADHYRDFPKL